MLAFLATSLYGLHPACAETVNYIIQRGDLYSTLGVIAGLGLFAARPSLRRYGIYLLPVAAAEISKPPALIFPVLLFAYVYLFEDTGAARAFRIALPSLALSAALGWLQASMTPATFIAGAYSTARYRITQPYVALRYFENFFLPIRLSADSDLAPLDNARQPAALLGFAFVAGIASAAVLFSRPRKLRPVAFGLWWFLLALAPTSLFPLAEVENDHRMFFPFAGLVISVVWSLALAWRLLAPRNRPSRALLTAATVLVLGACIFGTYRRNQVWRDEASLWGDVTRKSPHNGRGLMNFGLTLMAKGDMAGALDYFKRALAYTPNYYLLEINLGIAEGQLGNDADAQRHFERALALAPQNALPYFYYARWLDARGRTGEALQRVERAVELNPSYPQAQNLARKLRAAATARSLLDLSLQYHQEGRYSDCIRAAQDALNLQPNFAEAYNNIAAAYESMGNWDQAINAARQALRLKPDFELAHNNLVWSEAQKARAGR
ncbi:MAG: tetratricopeptide repeat protein [Bryobacterales bacterium]|nr:tetratricopeptide repeat protein [Bryobacterales bacterium]